MTNPFSALERCPVCRSRLNDSPVCNRCGSDLSPLVAILAESRRQFFHSVACVLKEDLAGAMSALQKAEVLKSMPLIKCWRAFLNSSPRIPLPRQSEEEG